MCVQCSNALALPQRSFQDNHSFSHEIYREVVYSKYIATQEQLIRWHYLMAKYFGQLPPCDRKLEVLPYHLEMAGSWSKVSNHRPATFIILLLCFAMCVCPAA